MRFHNLKNPYILISTGFGIGFIPFAPGTMASGFGLCAYIYLAHFFWPAYLIYSLLIVLLIFGWFATYQTLKQVGEGDHPQIVIDEIIGMMFVASFLPADPYWAISAFLIFRFFDIVKPYPISVIDKKYKNAFGIILDDMIAAAFSITLILVARSLLG